MMTKPQPAKWAWRSANLVKFTRSNQSTNINQRPVVKAGDVLQRGDVVAMALLPIWASWLWVKHDHRLYAVERLQLRRLDFAVGKSWLRTIATPLFILKS